MEGKEFMEMLKMEISKAVVGKEDVIELLTIALLSEGHVLIEGIPGVAKTTIAKAFSNAIGLKFSRIQLTPDLLPADIIGIFYYDQKTGEWTIKQGPAKNPISFVGGNARKAGYDRGCDSQTPGAVFGNSNHEPPRT